LLTALWNCNENLKHCGQKKRLLPCATIQSGKTMPAVFPAKFEAFVAPARLRSGILRTFSGILLFLTIYVALVIASAAILALTLPQLPFIEALKTRDTILSTFLLLGSVILMLPALWVVVRFLHKRPFSSLISHNGRINWRMWGISAGVFLILGLFNFAATWIGRDVAPQMPIGKWLVWALLVLPVLFLQTMTEELVFRGYLQQQLAARFASRWVWMVMPATLFALGHLDFQAFGPNAWLIVFATFTMGIIGADLTARMGDISATMGLHFANNLLVGVFLNANGQMSGISLFTYDLDLRSISFGVETTVSAVIMLAVYLVFVLVYRRRR